jgi:hypothetical protein
MLPPILARLTTLIAKRGRLERRAARRVTPGSLTPCQVRAPGEDSPRPAWVHNVSTRGAGILTCADYPPGTLLELLLVNASHIFSVAVAMTVVRSYRAANGDYFLGGEFARELTHDELRPFLL